MTRTLFRTSHRLEDRLRGLGPTEWLCGFGIVRLDVPSNLDAKFLHAREDAAVNRTALERGKPAFHGVEPRCARRRKVKDEAGVTREVHLNLGCRVRAAVVEDEVEREVFRNRALDLLEKR